MLIECTYCQTVVDATLVGTHQSEDENDPGGPFDAYLLA